mgnify:FL=1
MTEKPDINIADPDGGVNLPEGYEETEMPTFTESELAHQEMMQNPSYAVATHEQQLNKFANILEELVARVVALEQVINDMNTPDPNDPIKDYPEVAAHQNR